MTPRKKKDEEPRADETQEYELGDDFLEDVDDRGRLDEEELDDEDLDEEELEDEDHEDDDEDELEQVVSAETQEWDGLEAAEAEADEPTLVASAGQRVRQAGSAVTSGFEKVGGKKVTSGFKAVRGRLGFPLWLRFLTASFVIVAAVAGATSASLILYLSDIANALKHESILNGVQPFLNDTRQRAADDPDPRLRQAATTSSAASTATRIRRCCSASTPTGTRSRCSPFPATSRSTSPATAPTRSTRPTRSAVPSSPCRRSSRSPDSTSITW